VKPGNSKQVTVRLASDSDAERIAILAGQLGYPVSAEDAQQRLEVLQTDDDHAVYVAESNGHVVGWVHVYVACLVIIDRQAEIGGLVVDEDNRHCGVGRLLMHKAEEWAREKACWAVYLRSNVLRKDAHAFYEQIGYPLFKTSRSFRKVL